MSVQQVIIYGFMLYSMSSYRFPEKKQGSPIQRNYSSQPYGLAGFINLAVQGQCKGHPQHLKKEEEM